jgi:hypothetical protein
MENAKKMLAHLQAALDLADTHGDYLIGAHVSAPVQILVDRITRRDPPDAPDEPRNGA